ncbi:fluoride efflux transporter CrcB [Thermosipho ferrireducens]|uniref:Fluoride-specific ion channel FluC n=1 Tax=Thermosipho ferrireducens TaxID=2571116 RepID=A0ABX7S6C7_9BACT|nr:fluoride efflux transporter CrcB [Thermosipho ferrireducens]QTA37310.1 fluoride efflux transporter CrcB [Thermosipho ferrireducens]
MKFLLIGIGGALGALVRYILSKVINESLVFSLIPWGTIIVNSIGAFLLSFIMFSSIERVEISQNVILFFGTGFLGAFTTFSTFTYETLTLFMKAPQRAFIYFAFNIVLAFFSAYFGMIFGRGKGI